MKKYIILFVILLSPYYIHAQISGYVFEQKDGQIKTPMPGVNVAIIGTSIGVQTNESGYFKLNSTPSTDSLMVSFIGYKTEILLPNSSGETNIFLQADVTAIDEVVKIGKAKAEKLFTKEPIHTSAITSAGLKHAACCNLSESFENNASVDVSYSDAVTGAKQIQMLGLSGIYSQLLSENIPSMRGLARNYGLTYVPGAWLESIQISKGAASVRNGYESVTGQINAEFKKPNESDRFSLNVFADNNQRYELNADGAIPINEYLSTMAFIHADRMQSSLDHNNDGFMDHPNVEQYNLYNRWFFLKDNLEIQAGVKALSENRQGGQLSFNYNLPRVSSNGFGIDVNTKRMEAFTKIGIISQNRENTSWAFIGSYASHNQKSFYGLNTYNAQQNSFFANALFMTYIGNTSHGISTGLSLTSDLYNETLNDSNFLKNEHVPGVFTEYTFKPNEELTAMLGARIDRNSRFGTLFTPRAHIRYELFHPLTLRVSAGKGFRSPLAIAENTSLLASSKQFVFLEKIKMEEAVNYGTSLTWQPEISGKVLNMSIEFYRTNFENQLIVDMEQNVGEVIFYNLKGNSYSNSIQLETSYEILKGLDITAAYRLIDAKTTINGKLQEQPLSNRYKGLLLFNYATPMSKWQFNYTIQFNGGGRLPEIQISENEILTNREFPAYTIMNAQITRRIKGVELYIGAENLSSYMQENPVIAADSPFSKYFDASQVWGPLSGAMYYLGLRYSFK